MKILHSEEEGANVTKGSKWVQGGKHFATLALQGGQSFTSKERYITE